MPHSLRPSPSYLIKTLALARLSANLAHFRLEYLKATLQPVSMSDQRDEAVERQHE